MSDFMTHPDLARAAENLSDRELDALASSSGDDCDMTAVQCLVREVRRLRADEETAARASIDAHVEYKQRRNEQFAAYEQAHRATITYLLDRAEQYDNSGDYRALFDELIGGIADRDHIKAAEHGEYDDLRKNVDRIVGKRREGPTALEHAQKTISAQSARIAELEAERDRARRHLFAPERCPVCEWTNINLMNYGEPGKSRWMCHGCAARGLAAAESLAALGREACELGQRLADLECDGDAEDRIKQIELAIAAAVTGTENNNG